MTCVWTIPNLDGKTVEYEVTRNKKSMKGGGWLDASDLGNGTMLISIRPFEQPEKEIRLVQAEATLLKTHPGKYRFSCFSRS